MDLISRYSLQGPVSRKSRELFGPEKLFVKLKSVCFEKLIFLHVFNIRKSKRIAKFEGLEPRHCEDINAIVAPEIGPKSFGTFEKHAPGDITQNPLVRHQSGQQWPKYGESAPRKGHFHRILVWGCTRGEERGREFPDPSSFCCT